MTKICYPFFLLLLMTITGCVHSTVITYDDNLLAENERATLVTDSKDVSIERVDGKNIRTIRQFWDSKFDADVHLKPGEHTVEIEFWNGPTFGRHIKSFYLFKFNAMAGQQYRIVHKLYERSAKAYIVDVKTGQRVSKVIASQNEPVDDPAEIYENSVYFSILPPQDPGWTVAYRDLNQTFFVKEGSKLDESYAVSVITINLPNFSTKDEFVEYLRAEKDKNTDINRFTTIKKIHEYYSGREDFCVRYHTIAEDNAAVKISNDKKPMILEMFDYICRHPLNKNTGIVLDFSHRYYPGNQDDSLAEKAQKQFESLKF